MPQARAADRRVTSHGTGAFTRAQFRKLGKRVVIESGVRVFHPERIEIGDDVYVGHDTILKGYHKNRMIIGSGVWIGQQCFFHSAGGIEIGAHVGIGPGVKILTSTHSLDGIDRPILHNPIRVAPVAIGEGSDIGVGAIIMPGVRIGRCVQVGAGAVVTMDLDDYVVGAGVPAKVVRVRR